MSGNTDNNESNNRNSNKRKLLIWFAAGVGFYFVCAVSYSYLRERETIDIGGVTLGNTEESDLPSDNGQSDGENESEKPAEKIMAPDFSVADIDGNDVRLSDFLGMPVVLNFWASWCAPCKTEMPDFDDAFAEYGENVKFMMVNLTDGMRETIDDGKGYIKEEGFSFPVYFDTNADASNAYGISSIPTTIFIDKDGYAVTFAQGAINIETLRKGIELVLDNSQ